VAAVEDMEIEVQPIVVAVVDAERQAKATAGAALSFRCRLSRAGVVARVEAVKVIEVAGVVEGIEAAEGIEVGEGIEADLAEVAAVAP